MIKNPKVGTIMGSDSDLEVFAEAAKVLEEFGVPYDITVGSAHRSPERVKDYSEGARERGVKVLIAGAGGAAHLAGVVAAHTTLPVVGLPVKAKALDGLDSLLSTVNMPPGVPVATVGINAGKNAGLLAVQIMAVTDKDLEEKLAQYKNKMAMIEAGRKTLKFPNKRGVYINEDATHAHGAVFEYRGEESHIWCQTQEDLGNKNWIAEWMYQKTGKSFYEAIAIDTALIVVNDVIAQGAMPVVFTDQLEA